jgi:hypothetical protein
MVRGDLQRIASFHANKLAELGDPLVRCDEWATMIISFPSEWRELVKSCHYNSMELDVASKPKTKPGEWGTQPHPVHRCATCNGTFPTLKALEAHKKAKHKTRAQFSSLIGASRVCPCCHVEFSSRTRLLAHISEKRNRGGRLYSCNTLMAAGMVMPVDQAELRTALESDKLARTLARKAGHTVPVSESLAKRPRVGTSILQQQLCRRKRLAAGDPLPALPNNALYLRELKPVRRVRAKTSQDSIIVQHIKCA